MHRSVVFMAVVAMVLVLVAGAAVAKDEPVGKGKGQGSERVAAGSTGAKDKLSDKGKGKDRLGDKRRGGVPEQVTYVFKGSIAQDGEEGSPLKVKVDKANNAGRSFVGKQLELTVSPTTEIYLDDADTQQPELDARLPELKAGDKVVIQAKAPRGATRFTAGMISAEAPTNTERSAETPGTERMSPSASK